MLDYRALTSILDRVLDEPQPQPQSQAPRGASRRRPIAMALIAAAILLVTAAAALAAVGIIPVGTLASSANHLPHRGLGSVAVGGARMLSLEVPDPAGGPPWGLREVRTTRGLGCLQVGRVQGGQLGAIGEDGTFDNDGLFHPIGPTQLDNAVCGYLDAAGTLFVNAGWSAMQASAWNDRSGTCTVPPPVGARSPHTHHCASSQLRSVFFGVLGPDAESVTYMIRGHRRTVPTSGPEGAYLIVGAPLPWVPSTLHSIAPDTSVVKLFSYRDGSTCDPQYPKPEPCLRGYVPVRHRQPTTAETAAPVHARVVSEGIDHRTRRPLRSIEVSFKARVPVTPDGQAYELTQEYQPPHRPRAPHGLSLMENDVRAGQLVKFKLGASRPGTYSGTVSFVTQGTSPWPLGAMPVPARSSEVGRFRVVVR